MSGINTGRPYGIRLTLYPQTIPAAVTFIDAADGTQA